MRKFADIYLEVVKEKKLRNEVVATEVKKLPSAVVEDLQRSKEGERLMKEQRLKDKEVALRRLASIRAQIAKKNS